MGGRLEEPVTCRGLSSRRVPGCVILELVSAARPFRLAANSEDGALSRDDVVALELILTALMNEVRCWSASAEELNELDTPSPG